MISKKYRLKEREVQKVLAKGKPFFSSSLVFSVFPHRLWYTRFAIVISKKSVPNTVVRNIYRREFYALMKPEISKNLWDIVCVVKSKTKLSSDPHVQKRFEAEVMTTFNTILWKNT